MSAIEQGIELTIKVLMKVKDDEIMALCDAIKDRDNEIEKLRQENAALKDENGVLKTEVKEITRQRDEVESTTRSSYYSVKKELDDLRQIHQNEMSRKCQNALKRLEKQNVALGKYELLKMYCSRSFNFKNLGQRQDKGAKKVAKELDVKIKTMTEHQSAVLTVASDACLAKSKIESLKNELQETNICIYNDILERFGCKVAMSVLRCFPIFLDEDGQPRHYDNVDISGDGEHFESLYDYEFKVCDACDYDSKETCFYTREIDYGSIFGFSKSAF